MIEIKVMLASDSPGIENLIGRMLKREGILTEHFDLQAAAATGWSKKAAKVLLLICTFRGILEQNDVCLGRLLKEGTSLICLAGEGVDGGYLKGKEGVKVLKLPETWEDRETGLFLKGLLINLKDFYGKQKERRSYQGQEVQSRWLVGIGASTGGPKALVEVLENLSRECCGILVVQHLTSGFSSKLAAYLDGLCRMRVKEAEPDEPVRSGIIYLAPDGRQTRVKREGAGFVIKIQEEAKVGGFCPAVDCLFESLAVNAGQRSLGVVLTGMGRDGADGLLKMRQAGASTIGQDQESSAIYGMPYEALRGGGVERQLPVSQIGAEIESFNRTMKKKWGGVPDGTINISGR